ncbi:hypothetical protein [Winogradskyella ouciana]|uniref:Uncharacterized protein n=1 Tax=Winogradskyella ouciana TaxID=2608631 RepID=A0A7K1GDS2_9FLAO|nr:hypothetical protein [Winogradskyella ouciana]MTE27446.1 hypothetical protein [Winogradskyella ouciana]
MSEEIDESLDKPKKKIIWTTDKIMSTSALFISVISLIALLYQSYLAREENKLIQVQQSATVLPYLSYYFSSNGEHFKIIIDNRGVGPAFVKKVDILFDDKHNFDNTDPLFEHIFSEEYRLDSIPYSHSTFTDGLVLPAGKQIDVFTLRSDIGRERFQKVLSEKNLDFSIEYEDVYGARWKLTNDDANTPIPIIVED